MKIDPKTASAIRIYEKRLEIANNAADEVIAKQLSELASLREANAELVKALEVVAKRYHKLAHSGILSNFTSCHDVICENARAAIAKHKGNEAAEIIVRFTEQSEAYKITSQEKAK